MLAFLLKTFPHFCHWREGGERPQQNSRLDVEGPPNTAPSQPPSAGSKTDTSLPTAAVRRTPQPPFVNLLKKWGRRC